MKREKITISENGIITLPGNPVETVWMRDFEIAELFGIMLPTVKSSIRAILKSGVVKADLQHGGVVYGKHILPDYFGLDMITALAFRIHSRQASVFRKYIFGKLYAVNTQSTPSVFIRIGHGGLIN